MQQTTTSTYRAYEMAIGTHDEIESVTVLLSGPVHGIGAELGVYDPDLYNVHTVELRDDFDVEPTPTWIDVDPRSVSGLVGQEVTIWPSVGPGESRDTEPGLQPWQAFIVGVTLDGSPMVQHPDESDPRVFAGAIVQQHPVAGLKIAR